MSTSKDRVVLAYSGGLDTSVAIGWIGEQTGREVVAVAVDVGQSGEDLEVIRQRALDCGAVEAYVADAREEFASDYCMPALKANGLYEGRYPLVSALSRPVIVKHLVKAAREFGATDIVEERGEAAVARVREMTGGYGAHGAVEAVGNETAFQQALGCVRPGGHLGFVGVPHGVSLDMGQMFGAEVHIFGGPAPVRKYLPQMIDLIYKGEIFPGKVFDKVLPLADAAEGYAAMDQRSATKVLLTV